MLTDGQKTRVLVVDDDEITREMLQHILVSAGYHPDMACSGNEAWNMVTSGNYNLVLSDWDMPDGDGLDLCRRIRSEFFPGYIYFILVTRLNKSSDIVEGLDTGADDFITKPFVADEVRVRIRVGERILAQESRDVTIFAMAKLAESRDTDTGDHLERIQTLTRVLAQRLFEKGRFEEINQSFVRMIHLTSPLHDIGKVGIPDIVLLKPGQLNDDEFEIMKTHTTLGAKTLGAALNQYPDAAYLKMAHDIALSHHEKWDGTGYPNGLLGNDIPLAGRITALADVYDAVTSDRVYKEAYSHKVARNIILQGSGKHFDPRVVEAFEEVHEEFHSIREEMRRVKSATEEKEQDADSGAEAEVVVQP